MEEGVFCRTILISLIWSLLYRISAYANTNLPISSSSSSTTTFVPKGSKFILACSVPLSGIHLWYKDGSPIIPSSRNKYHLQQDPPSFSKENFGYFMTMRLIVEEAEAFHTGDYKCNTFSPYSQKVVVVTENMIETNEEEPGKGKILVPGAELVLQCNTTECPQCRIIWYKDGDLLSNVEDHLTIYDGNNSVVILDAEYEDSGLYTCAIDREQLDIALNVSISVYSEIKLEKFDTASGIAIQGHPLELVCSAKGAPKPTIKWFKGDEQIRKNNKRIQLLEHDKIKDAKLFIESTEYEDRDHYTCEAFNHVNSLNTTIFIRVKDRLAALWPFLGICIEVIILCSIILFYERRKNAENENETDLPAETVNPRDQRQGGQDLRQRK